MRVVQITVEVDRLIQPGQTRTEVADQIRANFAATAAVSIPIAIVCTKEGLTWSA